MAGSLPSAGVDKRDRLSRALARFAELATLAVPELRPADPAAGYRTRAKLVVEGRKIGLYAPGTHDVEDLDERRWLVPVLADTVASLRKLLPVHGLRGVDLREVIGGKKPEVIAVVIFAAGVTDEAIAAIVKRACPQ